ncbi:hypothetical protein ACE1CC_35870 [Aerosakkonemataceae cyanobacterium BLCC-F46]|uniref:Uncharacterized protein n=1 Tax=Floridaenema aerugineum BLCC-F46 TaxID=3153654 RepID=A0ABV4XHG9_9CYAN
MEIADDESMSEKFNELRADIDRLRRKSIDDLNRSIYQKEKHLGELESKINQATTRWNMIQNFLSAQGIKSADMMPTFDNLLSPAIVAKEYEADDEDDEY